MPNALLNTLCKPAQSQFDDRGFAEHEIPLLKLKELPSEFWSGDWANIQECFESTSSEKYDVILTSETIYSEDSQRSLYNLMKSALKPGTGVAFVAAKSNYFGCTGSLHTFLEKNLGQVEKRFLAAVPNFPTQLLHAPFALTRDCVETGW
ncbi:hypothetical protein HK102_011144 [Quaeritorhiza haematococci]|nr:hypothetical protein HK102_011144 [Quaeritorhiza haematococci]